MPLGSSLYYILCNSNLPSNLERNSTELEYLELLFILLEDNFDYIWLLNDDFAIVNLIGSLRAIALATIMNIS